MLPATTVAVSTERIMATAAMVMATSTISAMNSVTPRWRRRIGGLLWACRFMSARLPDPVAQKHCQVTPAGKGMVDRSNDRAAPVLPDHDGATVVVSQGAPRPAAGFSARALRATTATRTAMTCDQ